MNRASGTARRSPYIINLFGENVGGLDEYRRLALRRALIDMIIGEGNMDGNLPCGCFGQEGRLCKDARELWDQVQAAYWKANCLEGTWDEYARLHTQYLNHFHEQRELTEAQ